MQENNGDQLDNIIKSSFEKRNPGAPDSLWGKLSSSLDTDAEPVAKTLPAADLLHEKIKESFSSFNVRAPRHAWPAINRQLNLDRVWQGISSELDKPTTIWWTGMRAAAAILLLLFCGTGLYYGFYSGHEASQHLTLQGEATQPKTAGVDTKGVGERAFLYPKNESQQQGHSPIAEGIEKASTSKLAVASAAKPAVSPAAISGVEAAREVGPVTTQDVTNASIAGSTPKNELPESMLVESRDIMTSPVAVASQAGLLPAATSYEAINWSTIDVNTENGKRAAVIAHQPDRDAALAHQAAGAKSVLSSEEGLASKPAASAAAAKAPADAYSQPLAADQSAGQPLAQSTSQTENTRAAAASLQQHKAAVPAENPLAMSSAGGSAAPLHTTAPAQEAAFGQAASHQTTAMAIPYNIGRMPLQSMHREAAFELEVVPVKTAAESDDALAILSEEEVVKMLKRPGFEAGPVMVYHNSWLLNNETKSSYDKNSLIATDPTYKQNWGLVLNYPMGKKSQFATEVHIVSKVGQQYKMYQQGEYLQKGLELRYYKLYLQYQQNFMEWGGSVPSWLTAKAGVYGGYLDSKHGEIRQQEHSRYDRFDYGVRLSLGQETGLGRFVLGYGLCAERGFKNVFRGTEKLPADFNKTYILNIGTYLNVRYVF